MKKQLQIKTEDSKDKRGKVAILTEQTLPLTVIDDFIVRALGKKGVLGKNINRNKIQFIAENSNSSSSPSIVYGLMSSISSPSSSCPSLSLSSCLSRPLIEKGPNEGNYPDSLELIELNEPLNSSTPALTNSSTHEPLNLPTPELTNSSTHDFSPDPIYQTTSSLPPNEIVYYYHHDHLGNIRVVTDSNGNVVERHDFYPFGEEISQPTSKDQYLFTGKPRDSETGLDYFGARYYSSSLSRWLSADQITDLKRNIENPQRWNLYVYTLNNPLLFIDMDGRTEININIVRFYEGKTATIGYFWISKTQISGYTLELPWRDNIENKSSIPIGSYPAKIEYNSGFGYDVLRIPKKYTEPRKGILVHRGNEAKDTKGCILIGTTADLEKEYIYNSGKKLKEVTDFIRSVQIVDTITTIFLFPELTVIKINIVDRETIESILNVTREVLSYIF